MNTFSIKVHNICDLASCEKNKAGISFNLKDLYVLALQPTKSGLKLQGRKKTAQQKSNDKSIDASSDALKMQNLPKIAQLSRFQEFFDSLNRRNVKLLSL